MNRSGRTAAALFAAASLLGGCSTPAAEALPARPLVVTTTPIIADITARIAGEDAEVVSIVPAGADPHTYEPRLSTLRSVTRANIAIENGLLLEDASIRSMLEGNLPATATHLVLGEEALAFGGYQIPLVEDRALDTVWLGLRVSEVAKAPENTNEDEATGTAPGEREGEDEEKAEAAGAATNTEHVEFRVSSVEGPGNVSAFTTGTFGQPSIWLDSSDGIGGPIGATNAGGASVSDAIALPTGAHTHMSWGFSKAGDYTLSLNAFQIDNRGIETPLGSTTLRFAVGVEPGEGALTSGHVDLNAKPEGTHTGGTRTGGTHAEETRTGGTRATPSAITLTGEEGGRSYEIDPASTIIVVPHSAQTLVPADPQWRFLGHAGEPTWILAQAVIGKHVHGEIDPHMWLDVHNVQAEVEVITQALIAQDPDSAQNYRKRAEEYKAELAELDQWMSSVLQTIPERSRRLVTAHDAYGYLARGYGLEVTGFASANPSLEPSAGQLATLSATLRDLKVPAVFIESSTRSGAGELHTIAASLGIRVCSLNSDTLSAHTPSYIEAMVSNTKTLKACLDPQSLPAWDFEPGLGHALNDLYTN